MAEPFRGVGNRPSAGELARSLAHRLEDILPSILADCRIEPGEARGHGQDGALWVVARNGAKRGVALCASEPDRSGDMFALVTEALHGGDRRAAYAWALERCAGIAAPPAPAVERQVAEAAARDDRMRRGGMAKYLQARASIADTPAGSYLLGRGLSDPAILGGGLRFAPDCYYCGLGALAEHYPALVAPVINPKTRSWLAAHCTYLQRDSGQWKKLRRIPARKVWGRYAGGVIPLLRGASGKRLRHAPEEGVLLGEGIENTLSGAVLRPELRALAAVAIGNFAAIALPENFTFVVLVQDRDGENEGSRRARERAIDRWLHEGRGVEVLKPPAGYEDMNAWLQAVSGETSHGEVAGPARARASA